MVQNVEAMSNRRSTNTYADDGEHLDSDDLATEGVLAIAYYNVGINNNEILGKPWTKPSGKREKLKTDIYAIFLPAHGMQVLLICEYGQMHPNIDDFIEFKGADRALMTERVFKNILLEISLSHLEVRVYPPYVAIVDLQYWDVVDWQKCENLCDLETNFAAKLILQHKGSKNTLAAVVGHVPSTN